MNAAHLLRPLPHPYSAVPAPDRSPARCLAMAMATALAALAIPSALAAPTPLDLTRAIVVAPASLSPREHRAARLLVDEVERRAGVSWEIHDAWPKNSPDLPVIALGIITSLNGIAGPHATALHPDPPPPGPEGYRLVARPPAAGSSTGPAVMVLGHDARGVLFGAGRLVRELRYARAKVTLPNASLDVSTAPAYPLRGHQLGYRPKTHSYDAWDLPVWDQYYRDLILFGCNAVELIPPRSDDDADSPHFPRPPLDMMVGMSALADLYDLDVWAWYPALDADYSDAATVNSALAEWGAVFARLPRLDDVLVPGGDPGHTPPALLMALLEKQAANLRRHHPMARLWVSPQGFTQAWLDEFLAFLRERQPAWLHGIVYAPQVRIPLAALRQQVPARYPIRHYPDITHTRQCQYPVPDWDVAFALTESRECINPRPLDQATIFRATQPHTIGFITYSEGCNDDLNKAVWSALGWDPARPIDDILRDYARTYLGDAVANPFAQGLLALEQNWRGSIATNTSIEPTLELFQNLERNASPALLRNWRFQQATFRAHADAFVQRRHAHEAQLEAKALEALRQAPTRGSTAAMDEAERILARASTQPAAPELRQRISEWGEALFQSIAMQLSVSRHRAIAPDRGATLDTLDFPLNNRPWLLQQFHDIRRLDSEPARLQSLASIANWEDPGPGGFYDDLGNPARQPHLVRGATLTDDPGRMLSARVGFEEDPIPATPSNPKAAPRRMSWCDHAESLYDSPLRLHYEGLDPAARYRVRVIYAGDAPKRPIRLTAGPAPSPVELHPLMLRPVPFRPLEFDLPHETTASGSLTLSWHGEPGIGANGRGCQVSEVWLMRHTP